MRLGKRTCPMLVALFFAGLELYAAPVFADVESGSRALAASAKRGQPSIRLDRLAFPEDVAGSGAFLKHLRATLKREARRADWGAGRGSKIAYRFSISELAVYEQDRVLRVRCTAYGKLPGGKSAKSHLDYGGAPGQRNELVKRVLEIVARGVITRLAELERVRRGDLERSRVPAPRSGEVD